jgi:hypothetical protein
MNRLLIRSIRVIGTVVSLTLLSCGNVEQGLSPEGLQARGIRPSEGYIVGSFHTHVTNRGDKEWDPFLTMTLQDGHSRLMARRAKSEGSQRVWIGNSWPKTSPSLLGRPRKGSCFLIPVPPGNYEITGSVADPYNHSITYETKAPISVPFQVRAGEATDVGAIHVCALFEQSGLAGVSVPKAAIVLVADEHERNVALIRKTFPQIGPMKITRSDVPRRYMQELQRLSMTKESWWKW